MTDWIIALGSFLASGFFLWSSYSLSRSFKHYMDAVERALSILRESNGNNMKHIFQLEDRLLKLEQRIERDFKDG